MSVTRRYHSPPIDSTKSSHRAHYFPRALVTVVVLATLPFSAGCLPEMMVPALVAIPVLHACLTKNSPIVRPRPAPTRVPSTPIYATSQHARPVVIERALPQPKAPVLSIPREALAGNRPAPRQTPPAPAPTRVVRPTPPMETLPVRRTEPAPSRPPTAASAIMEGAQAYREMRWDDAAGILDRALGSGTCTNPEQNQAHILLGAIEYQQGDLQAAKVHFAAAYRCDRSTSPSPQLFPPQLIDFYRTVNGLKRP